MSDFFFTPTCYPPLGLTTVLPHASRSSLRFHALLRVSTFSGTVAEDLAPIPSDKYFTVILWHTNDGPNSWRPAKFREVEESAASRKALHTRKDLEGFRQDLFVLDLEYTSKKPLLFCLKYRFDDGPWLWSGSRVGGADGQVIFRPSENNDGLAAKDGLTTCESLFRGFEGQWETNSMVVSGREIYEIALPVATEKPISLGRPRNMLRWVALVKVATPWMGPRHGGNIFRCERPALMLLYQRTDGKVVLVLPVSGAAGTRYVLSQDDDEDERSEGVVWIRADSDGQEGAKEEVRLIIVVAENTDDALDAGFNRLSEILSKEHPPIADAHSGTETPTSRILWEQGLAYCTWNGLGWNLSEEKILGVLSLLDTAGLQVSSLIIDDNWQTITNRIHGSDGTWDFFEANHQFPGGLKQLTSTVRGKYPYVKHIGVWHAMHGYWDGCTPGKEIWNKYKTMDCMWQSNVSDEARKLTLVHPDDVEQFYDDFYKFLSESGITAVKADVMSRFDELTDPADRAKLSRAYQDALRKAGRKYLDSRVIYCRAHIPQTLYYSLLQKSGPKSMLRSSDDFYPGLGDAAHANHLFANSMNMLMFSRLHTLPDWDMFQTDLPLFAALHAVARSISGGPVYITDTPGHTNLALLQQMTAPSPTGRTLVLQPTSTAKPLDPFARYTENRLLRLWNRSKFASFLCVFNITPTNLYELHPVADAIGALASSLPEAKFTIRRFSTNELFGPLSLCEERFLLLDVPTFSWEVFTVTPIYTLPSGVEMGALGLLSKFIGGAAIEHVEVVEDGLVCVLTVLGTLAIFISDLMERGIGGVEVSVQGVLVGREFVTVWTDKRECIVDVITAWNRMVVEKTKRRGVEVRVRLV